MVGDRQQELVSLYWWEGRELVGSALPLLPGDTLIPLQEHDHWYTATSNRTKKVKKCL
jgi:hypothetical protein